LNLLEDRIYDMSPTLNLNGYFFSVSPRLNEEIILDPEIEKIIRDKVSKVKEIKIDNFMKLFTNGQFEIRFANLSDEDFVLVENIENLTDEVNANISSMGIYYKDSKWYYDGELTWGDIVNKLIKFGFQQDDKFDNICFPKILDNQLT